MIPATIPPLNLSAPDIVWRPSEEYREQSRLRGFMATVGVTTYEELVSWSATHPEEFWDAVVRDVGFEFYQPYTQVLDLSQGMPWARWFEGGLYNWAHDAVDKHGQGAFAHKSAVVWEGEEGLTTTLTYAELLEQANRVANGLRQLGVKKGDPVGVFLPMLPETVIAMLALAKLGALCVPIFSGYGAPAVADRLRDCQARVLITADGYYRRGRPVEMKRIADSVRQDLPALEHILVVRRTGQDISWSSTHDRWWHELVAQADPECETERTSPEDPYMLIYTSGTTGRPKGAVHVHAGFPIKAAQDVAHLFDVHDYDVLFWLTDIGWMMGPWAISSTLMLGATLVLYDGTPDYPHPDRLWDLAERHGVTVLGVAPTVVRSVKAHGESPLQGHNLDHLRVLGSTGEPWDPEAWLWLFEKVGKRRCPIINYSGGTEISGGIVGCTTLTPLKPCCFAGPVPGMAVDVVDAQGVSVRGEVGELVIRAPWPGMTRGFWNDTDRYLETYWSRFSDVWVHGDWAEIDADGFWYIRGRSDDTIKVAGKRVGPAEVESGALAHPDVVVAAAIGIPHPIKGESIGVFVVIRDGVEATPVLRNAIMETIVQALGKALKPDQILFVDDLPKTRNGKIMRRVIRAQYLNQPLGDLSSLDNTASIEAIARAW